MLGTTIEARPSFSVTAAMLLVVGAALLGLAVLTQNVHLAIFSALPFMLGIGLLMGRPKRIVVLIDQDGLRSMGEQEFVPYLNMHRVTIGGNVAALRVGSRSLQPLEVHHSGGVLTLPPVMNVPVGELYDYLYARLPVAEERPVPEILVDYLTEQRTKFGADKVRVIHARRTLPVVSRKRRRQWLGIAMLVVAAIWMGAGVYGVSQHTDEFGGWIVFGFFSLLMAIAFFLYAGKPQLDQVGAGNVNACLIIGPAGVALAQAGTKGALKWSEVLGVTANFSQWLRTRRTSGVQIRVQGAEIILLDIYEETPLQIEQLMRRNLEV